MKKPTTFKTRIKNHGLEIIKSIQDKQKAKELAQLQKRARASVFIIDFDHKTEGNIFKAFERDVNAVLMNADPLKGDKVFIRIKTPGGGVTAYADAAKHIERLRAANIHVTCFIDEIAASGGYMMASCCNYIVAQKMAMIGSIGVVATMPNIEQALEKLGVNVINYTSGKSKRTVTPTSKPTEEEKNHFNGKLREIHDAFIAHVKTYRPDIDESKYMDGDFYLAGDSIDAGLVDEIGDSYSAILTAFKNNYRIYTVTTEEKKSGNGIFSFLNIESTIENVIESRFNRIFKSIMGNEIIR